MIGAGAIGNEVVKNLVLLGVGSIELFDFDTVEIHNLTRSVLLREADVGRPKASSVAARARELDPALSVSAIDADFWHTLSFRRLVSYSALIVAVDNFEARLRANQLCRLAGVDWVNAAIDARHVSVEQFWFSGAVPSACYECALPESVYQRVAERYSCGGLQRAAWREKIMPTTTITAALAGAHAVNAALRLGADQPSQVARRLLIDSTTGRAAPAEITRNDACPNCSALPHRARRLSGKSANALGAQLRAAAVDAADVRLSDALIWRCACRRCGPRPRTSAYEGMPARLHSETITHCADCGEAAVAVEIRDSFTSDELAERFGENPPPVRYALAGDVLVDFQTE